MNQSCVSVIIRRSFLHGLLSDNAKFAFDFAINAAVRNGDCCDQRCCMLFPSRTRSSGRVSMKWATWMRGARKDIDRTVDTDYRPRVPEGVTFEARDAHQRHAA